MNFNKFWILLLVLPLLLVIVSAAENDDMKTYKMGRPANLTVQCLNNNTFCAASAVCNITVANPDTIIVPNGRMTNQVSYHNFTLTPSQTLVQGIYSANVVCQDGTVQTEPIEWNFLLTPSGLNGVLGLTIILFVIAYGLALFGFFGRNEWLCIIGGMAMMSLGLYSMLNGIDIYRTQMTDAVSIITIFTGAFFAIFAGVSLIKDAMDE